jgi:predicted Zn finger-like uncharacterized protein
MRLTCPNCGVEYELPDDALPAAGRHVQCSTCHTRWFVRATPRAALSEEQILSRLESRRLRPVAVPDPGQPTQPDDDPGFLWEDPEAAAPAPAAEAEPDEGAAPAPKAEEATAPSPSSGPRAPAGLQKPADRPTVPQPGAVADVPAPSRRPLPRLDLDGEARAPAPPTPVSRFAPGLLLVLVLFGIALGAYAYRAELAARVPAAGPTLEGYGAWVDGLRDDLEKHLAGLREPADG